MIIEAYESLIDGLFTFFKFGDNLEFVYILASNFGANFKFD